MTHSRTKQPSTTASQSERFKQAARELGCDDSEERFVETVRKIAKAPPQPRAAAKPQKVKARLTVEKKGERRKDKTVKPGQ